MERPTKQIKLPVSKYIADIATFFTRGESKEIYKSQWEGSETKYVNDELVIENVPVDSQQKRDDAILLHGIEKLSFDGKDIVVDQNIIDELPDKDMQLLLTELKGVYAAIEAKKK